MREALDDQHRTGGRLGDILLARGVVDASTLCLALAEQSNLPSLVREYEAVPVLPREVAYGQRAAVLAGPSGWAQAGPALVAITNLDSVPAIAAALGRPVEPRLADARTMDALLADAYAHVDGREVSIALPRRGARRLLEALGVPAVLALLVLVAAGAFLRPLAMLLAAVGVASAYWLVRAGLVAGAKCTATANGPSSTGESPERLDRCLPTCSVLVPLSSETPSTLRRLRRALDNLDYPGHRLQGLALLDPADRATRKWLRSTPLPGWITLLVAPPEAARGRRMLLLYGLRQARGQLLTVARPDGSLTSGSLREAAATRWANDPTGTYDSQRDRNRLTRRFLREAQVPWALTLAIAAGGRGRRRPAHFRTVELWAAFGRAPVAASDRVPR